LLQIVGYASEEKGILMAKVYIISEDGSTKPMTPIYCKDESKELQDILEKNPDLIPGISPSDPRRWLSVKKEMPVPDPNTGGSRWSIDFFFVDQDAMPTFIECKRFNDTRARREITGQMLEYAANAHYYWEKDELIEFAKETAQKNSTLEEEMTRLQPESPDSVEIFFQRVQDNLREGQIRLVFFLEKAPIELKSVVDFLNKQMERSEVLLVEAHQYLHEGMKVVVPSLFGFTEEARRVKKTISIVTGPKKQWNRVSFFQDADERLDSSQLNAIKQIFNKCESLHCELSWGKGNVYGTFSVKWPQVGNSPLFSMWSNGTLAVNFGSLNKNDKEKELRGFFKEQIVNKLNFQVPSDYEKRFPNYKVSEWSPKTETMIQILDEVVEKFPKLDA
jgi:hypothetical protein